MLTPSLVCLCIKTASIPHPISNTCYYRLHNTHYNGRKTFSSASFSSFKYCLCFIGSTKHNRIVIYNFPSMPHTTHRPINLQPCIRPNKLLFLHRPPKLRPKRAFQHKLNPETFNHRHPRARTPRAGYCSLRQEHQCSTQDQKRWPRLRGNLLYLKRTLHHP